MGRGTKQEGTGLGRWSSGFWEQDISLGRPGLSLETGVGPAGKAGMGSGRTRSCSLQPLFVHPACVGRRRPGEQWTSGPWEQSGRTIGEAQGCRKKEGVGGGLVSPGRFQGKSGAEDQPGCGSRQYIEGHFPNCDELGELGGQCLGAASSVKEYSRRGDGNSFRPRAEQGHSRLLAQGP